MTSRTTDRFRKTFSQLPAPLQQQARNAFRRFQNDPYHPSLRFKRVHSTKPVFSVRITASCRALGVSQDQNMIWFWIGFHDDYEKVIASL